MAINKDQFKQYTKGRGLPRKEDRGINKHKRNIFDRIEDEKWSDPVKTVKCKQEYSVINGPQTVHDPHAESAINGPQTVHDSHAEPAINGPQMVHDPHAESAVNGPQMVHDPHAESAINGPQTVHDPHVESAINGPQKNTINQTADMYMNTKDSVTANDKFKMAVSFRLDNITGIQKKILFTFYKDIKHRKDIETQEMTLEKVSFLAGVNQKSVKNSLYRMTSIGVIIRTAHKQGRGGWSKYKINPKIFMELENM